MKTLSKIFVLSIIGLFCVTTAGAETWASRLVTTEEIIIPGVVERVLPDGQMVRLKAEHGASVEVPRDLLGTFTGGDSGYQDLEQGLRVSARIQPGHITFADAGRGMIWVLVDGEQLVRLYPKDIDDDLFRDDTREIVHNNETKDVSLSEELRDELLRLEITSR